MRVLPQPDNPMPSSSCFMSDTDPCKPPAKFPLSSRVRDMFEQMPDLLTHEKARPLLDRMQYQITDALRLPATITDVTLSGALTNSGGAWLELNSPSIVNADTGRMEWLGGAGSTCFGEIYLHLPGAEMGASYFGQLRCSVEPAFRQELTAYIGVNVFGGSGGSQYGRLTVQRSPMIVPFVIPKVAAPGPWVAFYPSGLQNWRVADVSVTKL